MIDTTGLFGSTAPEPSSSAPGSLAESGFLATLGDVLAGMLDPEGHGLVQAVSGRSGNRESDGGEGDGGAPDQPTGNAPELDGARIASALRLATMPASPPAAAAGRAGGAEAAEVQDPRTVNVVSNGLGLLDPDGDLAEAPVATALDAASGGAAAADGESTFQHATGSGEAGARSGRTERATPSAIDADRAATNVPGDPAPPAGHRGTETQPVEPGSRPGGADAPAARTGAPQALDAPKQRTSPDRQPADGTPADVAPADGTRNDGAPSAVRDAAPVAHASPAAPTSLRGVATAPLVERLIRAIEHLQNQPPPRSFVVEIPEFDGLQIRVAVRHDGAIHLTIPGDRPGDVAMPILDAARAALTDRGFDLAHDSPNRRHPRDPDDSDLPRARRRNQAQQPRGLRI